jgi:hypothetical protein
MHLVTWLICRQGRGGGGTAPVDVRNTVSAFEQRRAG